MGIRQLKEEYFLLILTCSLTEAAGEFSGVIRA